MIGILSPEEIEDVLTRNRIGRLAMCTSEFPYIVPINYGYDGNVLYCFSGPGRKVDVMRKHPNVALLIDEITTPTLWRSVIIEGVYEELTDPDERRHGISAITHNGPHLVTKGLSAESGLVIYRIRPEVKTGRFEKTDA